MENKLTAKAGTRSASFSTPTQCTTYGLSSRLVSDTRLAAGSTIMTWLQLTYL